MRTSVQYKHFLIPIELIELHSLPMYGGDRNIILDFLSTVIVNYSSLLKAEMGNGILSCGFRDCSGAVEVRSR